MIQFFDKVIERLLKRSMLRKRTTIIENTIKSYSKQYQSDAATVEELKALLEAEAASMSAIIDKSVIHAGMIRARYIFWITVIISTALAVALAVYPLTTSIVPFFVPLMAAFVGWAVSVGTIPISYIQSVKGAMDATVIRFENERHENTDNNQMQPIRLEELQELLHELQEKIAKFADEASQHIEPVSEAPVEITSITNVPGASFWQSRVTDQQRMNEVMERDSSSTLDSADEKITVRFQ